MCPGGVGWVVVDAGCEVVGTGLDVLGAGCVGAGPGSGALLCEVPVHPQRPIDASATTPTTRTDRGRGTHFDPARKSCVDIRLTLPTKVGARLRDDRRHRSRRSMSSPRPTRSPSWRLGRCRVRRSLPRCGAPMTAQIRRLPPRSNALRTHRLGAPHWQQPLATHDLWAVYAPLNIATPAAQYIAVPKLPVNVSLLAEPRTL